MRTPKGGWGKGFSIPDGKRERAPSESGSKPPSGGVEIASARATEEGLPGGRYSFEIKGTSPRSVALGDLSTMLSARFSGDAAVKLDGSKETRIQDLMLKYEKSIEETKKQRERHTVALQALDQKQIALENAYKVKLGNVSAERAAIETSITAANIRLLDVEKEIKEREALYSSMIVGVGPDVQVSPEIELKVEALIQKWLSSLQDYDRPMPVEWTDLGNRLCTLVARVVQQTKDKMGV